MKGPFLLLLGLGLSVGLLGSAPATDRAEAERVPELERAIAVSRPGKVAITLDRDVYDHARSDLGDLRVLDDASRMVPYLLQRAADEPDPYFKPPQRLNRGFVRGQSATATLEFPEPVLKSELVLSLSGDNFRRRVQVEGRAKGDREWTTLTDGAYVFAVPDPARARYETVALPENNYPYLKVTVFRGPDDPDRIEILDVLVRPQPRRRPREIALAPGLSRTEDLLAHETILTLDLHARHQPFRGLVLEVADPRFFRGLVLEARRDGLPGPDGAPTHSWAALGEGTIYRYPEPDGLRERRRVEVAGREAALRLRIRNRDDRPLDVRGVTVMVPVERLVFEAAAGRTYRLAYSAPGLLAPSYDVERTVGDAAPWIAQATEGVMEATPRHRQPPARRAWTERHPALLWSGLIAVVVLLGGLTWRALRSPP